MFYWYNSFFICQNIKRKEICSGISATVLEEPISHKKQTQSWCLVLLTRRPRNKICNSKSLHSINKQKHECQNKRSDPCWSAQAFYFEVHLSKVTKSLVRQVDAAPWQCIFLYSTYSKVIFGQRNSRWGHGHHMICHHVFFMLLNLNISLKESHFK